MLCNIICDAPYASIIYFLVYIISKISTFVIPPTPDVLP